MLPNMVSRRVVPTSGFGDVGRGGSRSEVLIDQICPFEAEREWYCGAKREGEDGWLVISDWCGVIAGVVCSNFFE